MIQNKLWIENFIDSNHTSHATQAIYQTRLQQIKSQAVASNPLARKIIFLKYLFKDFLWVHFSTPEFTCFFPQCNSVFFPQIMQVTERKFE